MAQRAAIASARRVVVKFGSALLAGNDKPFHRFAAQLNPLRDQGKSVVLVSSGAIAQGVARLQLKKRPPGLAFHQSLAAVGQPALMAQWADAFGATPVAQFLIGKHDVTDPLRFLNGRRALRSLEEKGVIPIGNENDTVVTEEIRIGDNDNLGAYVARLVSADALIILTQVDGLYDSNPEKNPKAKLISTVQPNELETASTYASGASSNGLGVGGFETKLQAARIATAWGIPVVVANGQKPSTITAVLNGEEEGTLFAVPEKAERKHWLQYRYPLCGQLELNDAAADAAENGQDIWLHDIKTVHGDFSRGDTVAIARARDGVILGRGLVGYSSTDMQKYGGFKPEALVAAMGNKAYDGAVIHSEDYMLYAKRRLI